MGRVRQPEARIGALLGPTNTGKTHRAIERMLAHDSGMIGLPLRLLAREVYDKVAARAGSDAVALVTGEEKRIPADPRYFVCTVEAMPLDRPVAFLAVDEIQLAGDRNRGHTFTDRLLWARGVRETLFLGSETVRPLLERLVPGVVVESAPRLSKLSWAGCKKLVASPPRSALVAFSAEQVYAYAHQLRSMHGGAAVVLGALSPRTRNAQVAMYQAGEVAHLVATDAIGMGLNMDVAHVGFTAVRKYDGRGHRALTPAELAQIAGRAGRYTADGTFGTTREVGDLDPSVIEAIESHSFPPLDRLFWRSSDLDYSTPETLLRTLRAPPPHAFLTPAWGEVDEGALEVLSRDPELRPRLQGRAAVQRLWEVCQIPDFRKTETNAHTELLAELAHHLVEPGGTLPDELVERHVRRLDRVDGDLETLMARIAWIRTFTYVAWQRDWTRAPAHWQAETRRIEDHLSDALHERLTEAFVDRRVSLVVGAAGTAPVEVVEGAVRIGGIDVGRLRDGSFEVVGSPPPPKQVVQAVRRRLRSDLLPLLGEIEAGPDEAITFDAQGGLRWGALQLGRWTAGPDLLEPKLILSRFELLEPAERERLRARLTAWRDRTLRGLFAALHRGPREGLTPAGRGLAHAVERGLGAVPRVDVDDLVARLTDADRKALARLDLRVGLHTVYVASLLRPRPMALRGALWSLAAGRRPLVGPPPEGRTSAPADTAPEPAWRAMGFRVVGPLAVRVDVLEALSNEVRAGTREGELDPLRPMSRLGCDREAALGVIRALGYQLRSGDGGGGGPLPLRRAR